MGKISQEARDKYSEKSKEYKTHIQRIQQTEEKQKLMIKGFDTKSNFVRLNLANENLNLVSYYVLLHSLSISLLGVKNESYLNNGRKCCYKSLIYLEEIVSNMVDVPFSEYEDKVKSIDAFDDIKRYKLVRKLGYSIDTICDEFGANSKWKWSFVELEGRFAVVSKNLINLKTFVGKMDPRVDGYPERINFLELVKAKLHSAADKYREKYELSTRRIDDLKLGIQYLSALKRLLSLTGQTNHIVEIKKKMEVWQLKMEADAKKSEHPDRFKKEEGNG